MALYCFCLLAESYETTNQSINQSINHSINQSCESAIKNFGGLHQEWHQQWKEHLQYVVYDKIPVTKGFSFRLHEVPN